MTPRARATWVVAPALLALAAIAGGAGVASAAAPAAPAGRAGDAACMQCHSPELGLAMPRGGRSVSLVVQPSELRGSAHAGLACVRCHAGFDATRTPHRANITPVRCESCHPGVGRKHVFHTIGRAAGMAPGAAGVSCKGCHGTHGVQRLSSPNARLGGRELDAQCGRCHTTEAEHFARSAHGRAAAAGQDGAPHCITCHAKPITREENGGAPTVASKTEQEKLCLSCHRDDPAVRARMTPGAGFIAAYDQSVHGRALRAGNAKAATCTDCHGSHDMAKGYEPGSKANKRHISATCGACHTDIARTYDQSVHGAAVARGVLEAPSCTDCHGEHTIRKANDVNSPVAPANVSEKVCSPCHSSVRLSAKYGIRNDRFKTYEDSFHGLAVKGGSVSAANCASCHGAHNILPSSDPRSTIAPGRLAATCGQCHAGATAAFATGKVHVEASEKSEPALYWVALIYTLLIVGTVGGMAAHNALDFYRKARHQLAVRRGLEAGPPPAGRALYLRMTKSERLQHGTLLLSFVVLVVTGFLLRYPETWFVDTFRRLSNTLFDLRGVVHRVAGVVLVTASIYHIVYLTATARGREFFRDIMLRPSDLKDLANAMRWYLGRTHARPRFGRFSYVEKSEYWALVWGTVVMGVTGVILWFQDPFIALLSKLGWDVARTVHFYEAVLATLAIIVWHLYFVIFNPDVYPMNVAWLKGTVSEAEMEEEHPLELEAIRRRQGEEAGGAESEDGGTS